MEEDIKILEKMIDLVKRTGIDMTLANKIENLLTRYKQLEEDYTSVYLKGIYDEREKWKSKIKERIEGTMEELFEEMEECNSYDEEDNEEKRQLTDMIVLLKEVLQELLEEEK